MIVTFPFITASGCSCATAIHTHRGEPRRLLNVSASFCTATSESRGSIVKDGETIFVNLSGLPMKEQEITVSLVFEDAKRRGRRPKSKIPIVSPYLEVNSLVSALDAEGAIENYLTSQAAGFIFAHKRPLVTFVRKITEALDLLEKIGRKETEALRRKIEKENQ